MLSGGDTKQQLIIVAEKLFSDKGFHAVTVRDVTSAAQCNVSSINYHFGDKYGLIEAVFAAHFQEIQDKLEEQKLYSLEPYEQLQSINIFLQENLKKNLTFFRLMYQTFFNVEDKKLAVIVKKTIQHYVFPLSERLQFACKKSQLKEGEQDAISPLFPYYLVVGMNTFWALFSPVLVNVFEDAPNAKELKQRVFQDVTQFLKIFMEQRS